LLIFLAVLLLLVGVVVLVGIYSSIKKRSAAPSEPDTALSSLVPYTNPRALTAYYCSVFSMIPGAGLVLGPAALILGFLGFRAARGTPTAKGAAHALIGMVLGAIGTIANWGGLLLVALLFLIK
jgi:hypothetical protein